MEKSEALEFLELKGNATDSEIVKRLTEKKIFFQQLSQNAPSDFLQKLHLKNLEKIEEISRMFAPTSGGEQAHYVQHHGQQPVPQSSGASHEAWLIRHTEGFSSQTFPLVFGINYIGRQPSPGYHSVILENDPYVSRQHAVIDLAPDRAVISDSGLYTNKPSKNGVYVNGNPSRITGKVPMKDGDTIQVGNTKLMIKLQKNRSVSEMVKEVSKTEYIKTVVIDIF